MKGEAFVRELVRWSMIITIWNLAHQNFWALAIAIALSSGFGRRVLGADALPHDVVQITVDGKAEHVKA